MNINNNKRYFHHLKVLIFILIVTIILITQYIETNIRVAEPDLNSECIKNNNINNNYNNDKNNKSFTIITGASENHFCPLKAFLYYMNETLEGFNYNMVVYDLGLSMEHMMELKELKNFNYISDLRVFNFSKYPSFWDINIARGEYGWKPGMVKEVSEDYPGTLIWLDSGTRVERFFFKKLKNFIKKFGGFISPTSPGLMEDWTHPGVYEYFKDDHTKYDKLVNCNGGSMIFDTYRVQHLIDQWYDCALVKDCIAPVGSSRVNHRQDQALLTYLAARDNRYCNEGRDVFGISTHLDKSCKEFISDYELNHPELLIKH